MGWGLGGGWALCSGPTRPEKALGCWGAGLRLSTGHRGPQSASGPRVQRIRPRTSAGSPGPDCVEEIPATFPPILQSPRVPPCSPLLYLPASLPCPHDPRSQRGPHRMEDQAWDSSRLPGAQVGRGNTSRIPLQSSKPLRVSPHPP